MMSDLGARLQAAMRAEATSAGRRPAGDRDRDHARDHASLAAIHGRIRSARRRRQTLVLGVVVAVVGAVLAVPRLGDDGPNVRTSDRPDTAVTTTVPPPDRTSGSIRPGETVPPPADAESPGPADSAALGAGYQPLWPFTSQAEAQSWQEAYRAGGHQPWHLDAGETALSFTGGFLGFTEIDQVISRDVGDTDAYVAVGYTTPDGQPFTAAVVHLRRFGTGSDAPWEVVGSADDQLTLDTPGYGTTSGSPVTVGGTITGVDESLRIQVRQASSGEVLGEHCCLPAGGDGSPWQVTVAFAGATDPALTIVVSTGGHIQEVERFAVTGVRPAET